MRSKIHYKALEDIYLYEYIKLILNNCFTSFHIVCEKTHNIYLYEYIELILNNCFTSFHIVCEKPHDNVR